MSICAFSGSLGTTGLMILSTVPCSFFRFLPMAPHRVRRVLVRHFIKELAWSNSNKRKKTGVAVLVGVGDWFYLFQAVQFPIDVVRIERFGVETVTNPFQVLLMLRMFVKS